MPLTVVLVAYPFAPVGPDAAGGAEQVVAQLDAALVAAGHRSVVLAREDSQVRGELVPLPVVQGPIDAGARARVHEACRRALATTLRSRAVDLVHAHGVDFHHYLPRQDVPMLVTLHLPLAWYPVEALAPARPRTWLHGVSWAQVAGDGHRLLPPIPNGVPVRALRARVRRRGYACTLGRICPEKGYHLAVDAARHAGVPIALAGEVFPYEEHRRYFDAELRPRLGDDARYIGPVGLARKRRLLSAARCLVVPSLVAETSSLVAMEALACGTPVVCFPAGALPEIVDDGVTGFVVDDVAQMADAIAHASDLDAEACRTQALARFDAGRTTAAYLARYGDLARA